MTTHSQCARVSITRPGLCLCVAVGAVSLILGYRLLVPDAHGAGPSARDDSASASKAEPPRIEEPDAAGERREGAEALDAEAEPGDCDGDGTWDGCRGTGCMVCWEKVIDYGCYFENHPACSANMSCGGELYDCDDNCPEPTAADRCLDQSPIYMPLLD